MAYDCCLGGRRNKDDQAQPVVEKDAEAIKKIVNGLPGLVKFLNKEGGPVRWHTQF